MLIFNFLFRQLIIRNFYYFKLNILKIMSVESNTEGAFICIECFHRVKSIFKVYQDGFKDIIQCVNLINSIYFEFEFLNLILESFSGFKARSFKIFWDLGRWLIIEGQ